MRANAYRQSATRNRRTWRIVAILLSIGAGLLATFLMLSPPQAPAATHVVERVMVQPDLEDILVASKELPRGKVIEDADLKWQAWPKAAVFGDMIVKSRTPDALAAWRGAIVRGAFFPSEPLRGEKLVQAGRTGFMSAILPTGSRAVAISIDSQGATSAGGFILPNDRVDVIGTYVEKDDSGKAPKVSSETLLTNIRVLAIGQNVQEKNGERVIVGSNATLEANPMQAERLVLAQRRGALSLTLRSMVDFADEPPVVVVADTKPALPSGPQFVTVSVVRNGTRHEYSVLDTRPTVAQ